jgi:hypothetical protein
MAHLLGSLQKGPLTPSTPNPSTHIPTSTLGQRAFAGHNMARLLLSMQKAPTEYISVPNPTLP